jgi:8-amino-7-oxononanoate synthase
MIEDWINVRLIEAEHAGLTRQATAQPQNGGVIQKNGKRILNFSGNDYLNLSKHPHVIERARTALETYGSGATASRLVSGTLSLHEELEARLAQNKQYPHALLYGSGYLTSIGTIPHVVDRHDLIFADRLVHACMLDGVRLSGAKLIRFKHNDPVDLQQLLERHAGKTKRRLILTESVYSMDGDLAPLKEIAQLAANYEAMLMVDEAHAVGIYGPNGEGRVRELDLASSVTLSMGTLSKALAGYGGYVCCSEQMRRYLVQHSRSFIYTTAPPPAQVGAALGALDVLEETPNLGKRLLENACRFRTALHDTGLNTLQSESQIIPVVVGENKEVMRIAARLREQDILVGAIRPPTVPEGTARLRVSLSLAHSETDIDRAIEVITQAVQS